MDRAILDAPPANAKGFSGPAGVGAFRPSGRRDGPLE